jgi:DNA-binding protein YbaB
MHSPKEPPEISKEGQKMLNFFAQDAFPPVEATADDLVSVRMTSRFELTEVRIWQVVGRAPEMALVEQAIRKAVNAAIRDVGNRNARRLNEYAEDPPTEP